MIIALNNKSNLNKIEFEEYQNQLENIEATSQMIVCPTYLNVNAFRLKKMNLGAQNVSATTKGAYTGEISAEDLKTYHVEYCIVGHSERRKNQHESFEEINHKLLRLEENEIIPILCIGETKEEREQNKVKEILKEELESAIQDLKEKEKIIIAYEPIWSIGTGIIPTKEEIIEVFEFIKTILPNNKILYGGSANEKNIEMLKTIPQIDGFLLGGLSLKPNELQTFINILENRN